MKALHRVVNVLDAVIGTGQFFLLGAALALIAVSSGPVQIVLR